VNTVGDETSIWLNEDGTRAFITSWDAEESRQLLYDVHLPVDARPEAWCSLELHVRDAAQGTPIPSATIVISDASNEPCATRVDTDEYGVAIVALLPHQRYTITTQAQGYTSVPQTVRLQQLDSLTPLRLTAYLFDTTAPLASLYFERGEAEVTSTERDRLRALVDSFGIRAIAFRVTGYTDELGSKPFNQTLSAKRANAVVEALVAMGFSPERIISEGRGVEIPKVALGMRENPQSRRVDIFAASAPPRATTPRQSHQVPPSSSGRRPR
jgi:peptidoglycan-associated lipoprotein